MQSSTPGNYEDILTRCKSAINPLGEWTVMDTLSVAGRDYPLIKIVLGKGNPNRVLISAGIHGDEPAGVEAVCTFLENKAHQQFLADWEFTILPCINPTGYEAGTRNNHDDIDLNRKFNETPSPREVIYVQSVLNQSYLLDLELHEDEDSDGYYLFQKNQGPKVSSLGRTILERVKPIHAINQAEEIEGYHAESGLLSRLSDPDDMEWWPMALYAYTQGCGHVFTLESSPAFPMEVRVQAHLTAIQAALETACSISL